MDCAWVKRSAGRQTLRGFTRKPYHSSFIHIVSMILVYTVLAYSFAYAVFFRRSELRSAVGISLTHDCNGRAAQEAKLHPRAKFRRKRSNRSRIWRFFDFSIFPRGRPSAILDLCCVCWDHPQTVFGGLYRCSKLGWNRRSSFNNMQLLIFCEFGLKTPIHAPKIIMIIITTRAQQ